MEDAKILVVDDEQDLCNIIKFNLEDKGCLVDVSYSAEDALQKDLSSYSLILLDVMMKDISGFEMLSIMRNEIGVETPVIFITAMNSEEDVQDGFKIGAEDYIEKPFSIAKMLARVFAVLNRNKAVSKNNLITMDSSLKQIRIGNSIILLTRKEFEIFTFLYERPGKVFSRDEISDNIWPNQKNILGRTVDVNITRLRKKMNNLGKYILTRHGYGYYFNKTLVEA